MNESANELRPRMMSVAYRMLGSVADAEDAVQEAYLRLQTAKNVDSPEGFLVKATTHRCIDQLRTNERHQKYIGPWVPEPIDTKTPDSMLADSLSQAFLLMLERLSPDERAAYLLRTVFDYDYAEIARVLEKTEGHVRQIVSRARSHLLKNQVRFQPEQQQADGLADQFIAACRAGNVQLIEQMLTEEVEVYSDGGGKVSAARVIIRGRGRSARFLSGVFSRYRKDCQMHPAAVNGSPGVVFTLHGAVVQVASLHLDHGVKAVYMTLNPDKLSRWSIVEID